MPVTMGKRPGDPPAPGGRFGGGTSSWIVYDGHFDLTRGDAKSSFTVKARSHGNDEQITLCPKRSALVIVDMQNCFLHPDRFAISAARLLIPDLKRTIEACRQKGIQIVWLNWGVTDSDIETMPAAYTYLFSNGDPLRSFGSEMGRHFGRKLVQGTWNAQTYDELYDVQEQGIKSGTDILLHKNRLSGLWHDDTPLSQYLKSKGITSLLFTGVNTDQCVFGTLLDAFHRGYDTILVSDLCCTPTPSYTTEMVIYTASLWGWVITSNQLVEGLNVTKSTECSHEKEAISTVV